MKRIITANIDISDNINLAGKLFYALCKNISFGPVLVCIENALEQSSLLITF